MSTGNKHKNSESVAKNIRFKHSLIEQIEESKDPLIPFAAFVQQACREKLAREKNTQVHESKPVSVPVSTSKNMNTHKEEIEAAILNMRSVGHSAKVIAEELNGMGYLSANLEPFRKSSVEGILRRLKKAEG